MRGGDSPLDLEDSTMICTICGFDNPADGRFCKKCGAALLMPGAVPASGSSVPEPVAAPAPAVSATPVAAAAAPASSAAGISKPMIIIVIAVVILVCLLYTSDAADDLLCV